MSMNKYELAYWKATDNPGKWVKTHTGYYLIKVGGTVYEICHNGKHASDKKAPWGLYVSTKQGRDAHFISAHRTRGDALEAAELRTGWRSPWGRNTISGSIVGDKYYPEG